MSLASDSLPPPTAAVRSAVVLLSLAAFFSGIALRIGDGLLPRLASEFGTTPGVAGRVVLTFAVAYGLAQLLFGPLADRYGKARMITIALFASAGGALLCALAPDFPSLVVLRGLWGAAAAGIIPLAMAWVGDAVPYEQRQTTLARLLMGTVTGMTAGQLAGGLFADSPLGWRGAFAALAVGYGIVAVLLLSRLRSMPEVAPAQVPGGFSFFGQLGAVLARPWARRVVAAVMAEGLFLFGSLAFLPAYLHQRFGITLSAAGALLALFAAGGILYTLVARTVVRRFGEKRMVRWGGVLMGLGFAGWYFMPVAWLAAPLALLVGFGTYLFHATLQTNATQMAPAMRGSAMACFASCFFLGQAAGVSLAGHAFDHFGAAPMLLVPAVGLPLTAWAFARALQHRP